MKRFSNPNLFVDKSHPLFLELYQVSGVSAGTSEQGRPGTDMTENFLLGIT